MSLKWSQVKGKSPSGIWLFAAPWTIACRTQSIWIKDLHSLLLWNSVAFSPIYLPMGLKLISSHHHPSFLCLRVYFPNQIWVNFQPVSVSSFQSNKTGSDLFCISFNVIIHSNSYCLAISLLTASSAIKEPWWHSFQICILFFWGRLVLNWLK